MLLNEQSVLRSLLEVELEEVSRLVAAEQALDQDAGTVALEAPLKPVNIYFKVEFVLLSTRLVTIVSYVPFHILVEAAETVTK